MEKEKVEIPLLNNNKHFLSQSNTVAENPVTPILPGIVPHSCHVENNLGKAKRKA